jgi:hypothetical protein
MCDKIMPSPRLVEDRDSGVPFFPFSFAYPLTVKLSVLSTAERLVSDCLHAGAFGAVVVGGRRGDALLCELAG